MVSGTTGHGNAYHSNAYHGFNCPSVNAPWDDYCRSAGATYIYTTCYYVSSTVYSIAVPSQQLQWRL